jgi:hypothetical protein
MDNNYRLLDFTVYGRQEHWEDSPAGWPQLPKGEHPYRRDGRPIVQWPRISAGYSDDLRQPNAHHSALKGSCCA